MRLASSAALVLAAVLALSGCAAPDQPAPYATATAADLQQTVLNVTKAAGDGEFAAARTRLDELEVATKVAFARGEITEPRQNSILAAVALVRADLESLIAKAEAAAAEKQRKAEEKAREAAEKKAAEERAAEEARQAEAAAQAEREAAEQAARQQAADDADGGGDSGKGNADKGNGGNGKGGDGKGGKGKGKGKGKG